MIYCVYYIGKSFGENRKMYLVDLPNDENYLSGIGFQSDKRYAGTCPTEDDAYKLIAWLKEEISEDRPYKVESW